MLLIFVQIICQFCFADETFWECFAFNIPLCVNKGSEKTDLFRTLSLHLKRYFQRFPGSMAFAGQLPLFFAVEFDQSRNRVAIQLFFGNNFVPVPHFIRKPTHLKLVKYRVYNAV